MTSFQDSLVELVAKHPEFLRARTRQAASPFEDVELSLDDTPAGKLPAILLPIDRGAKALLEKYQMEPPQWNALEVETLMEALSARIEACLTLRERAQDLEVQQLDALLDFDRLAASLPLERQEVALRQKWEPLLAQNKLEGSASTDYWTPLATVQKERLALLEAMLESRGEKYNAAGSGNHLVERFDAIQRLFRDRLLDAYRLARAVSAGLQTIYSAELATRIDYEKHTAQRDLFLNVPRVDADWGYLTALAQWVARLSEELDRVLSRRAETIVCIGFKPSDRVVTFSVAGATTLNGLKNPRLRGVRVVGIRDKNPKTFDDCWPISLSLPPLQVAGTEVTRKVSTVATTVDAPLLTDIPWSAAVHNLDPAGTWSASVSPGITYKKSATASVSNFVLEMKVAYGFGE